MARYDRNVIEAAIDGWIDLAMARDTIQAEDSYVGSEAESVLCGAVRAGIPLVRWQAGLRTAAAAPVLAELKSRRPDDLSPHLAGYT